jgi:hypothetical protein
MTWIELISDCELNVRLLVVVEKGKHFGTTQGTLIIAIWTTHFSVTVHCGWPAQNRVDDPHLLRNRNAGIAVEE